MEHVDTHSRRVRWALFVVAAVALSGTLVTCKSVTDNVLGSRTFASETANCVSACAHAANELMQNENKLHKDNVDACNGDPTCLAQEEARHDAAVDSIQEFRKRCQAACHHQGSGKGGR
jgi:hypothetical protein